jgi:telomere length regulation protein
MIVGTGMSGLIEEPDKALKFDLEEMRSEEAHWFLNLTKVQDDAGSFESIKILQEALSARLEPTRSRPAPKSKPSAQHQGTSKIVAIEEIEDTDEEEEEDDDLIPYEKPDDDAYDSDEDPTLIQRNKPIAPV